MSERNETIADIIAEMRKQVKLERKNADGLQKRGDDVNYGIWCSIEEDANYLESIADRLEAALKREVDELNSAIQATVGRSDAEIDRLRREIAEMRQAGDAAKLPDGWKMYDKYQIRHTDGTPLKGKRYFVLRLDSDDPLEAARVAAAMSAYKGETPQGNAAKLREAAEKTRATLEEALQILNGISDEEAGRLNARLEDVADAICEVMQWIIPDALAAPATTEKSSAVGDCAKLREALDLVDEGFTEGCLDAPGDCPTKHDLHRVIVIREKVKSALAAPPRNCKKEVGNGD